MEHLSVPEADELTEWRGSYNLFAEDLRVAHPSSRSHTTQRD